MCTTELTSKIEDIKTIQVSIDELTAELEALKDEVKNEMTTRGVDEMTVSCFKVHYKEVTTNRFDSNNFKAKYSDLYNQFLKTTVSKRFSIN